MTETTAAEAEPRSEDLDDPGNYINRELSWLEFNERVLELAEDASLPLLERVKFAAIYASNLDEFFMVRVAGLKDQIEAGVEKRGINGFTPRQTLDGIRRRVLELAERQTACVERALLPALAEQEIRVTRVADVTPSEREVLSEHFRRVIFPALTPLAVGPGQRFAYISNLSLSLGVIVRDPASGHSTFARVKVPIEILPRFVSIGKSNTFVMLEDVIAHNLDSLFQGMDIVDYDVFRVSRDADLSVSDEAADLLRAVEDELRRRRFGEVVRVEVGAGMSEELLDELIAALGVEAGDVYAIDGPLDLTGLWEIVKLPRHPELRETPWVTTIHPRFRAGDAA